MNKVSIYRLHFDRRFFRVAIEKVCHNERVIRYRVTGRNKSLVLESNEPLLRKKGIRQRMPDWKLVEGQLLTAGFIGAVIRLLEEIRKEDKKQPSG